MRVVPVNCGLLLYQETVYQFFFDFSGCIYILMGTILYRYGWNRSVDNKFMNLYLTVCRHEWRISKFV